jgi:hypothetical protein
VPRALSLQRTVVIPTERERFLARARALRTHYQGAGCRYWVFEDSALPGAFIEFAEAPGAELLAAANQSAPDDTVVDPGRIYREMEL